MKIAQIIHNPTSGNAEHSKKELVKMVEKTGYEVNYISTDDEGWEKFDQNNLDLIFVAGGDGTVRKLAAVLLKNNVLDKQIPIHLLPLGTANNIAKSLGIPTDKDWNIKTSAEGKIKKFSCGRITGLQDEEFFLESVGFGIFPELLSEMENNKIEDETPSEELKRTLKVLLKIVKEHKAQKAKIKVDGITIKGSFLLVELMNIKFIGPNLELAPNAQPADNFLDLVLIPEKNRAELELYLNKMIKEKPEVSDLQKFVKILRVQKAKMKWKGSKAHVDDNLINDYSGKKFKVEVNPGALKIVNAGNG